jgi:hypothetical protein
MRHQPCSRTSATRSRSAETEDTVCGVIGRSSARSTAASSASSSSAASSTRPMDEANAGMRVPTSTFIDMIRR